jgi:hypothetical protein
MLVNVVEVGDEIGDENESLVICCSSSPCCLGDVEDRTTESNGEVTECNVSLVTIADLLCDFLAFELDRSVDEEILLRFL